MPILDSTDSQTLDEIRWTLDTSLTSLHLPDNRIQARNVLPKANRSILKLVGMTETEYQALPEDDVRRQVFVEAAINKAASILIPTVAQLIRSNVNGIYTQYQRIDWKDRSEQIDAELLNDLAPYMPGDSPTDLYTADSSTKEPYPKKYYYYK